MLVAPNGVHCTRHVERSNSLSCLEQIPGRPGVRCSGAFGPNVPSPPAHPPPTSYSFSEIGKPGVPHLDAATLALFRRIKYDVRSDTLRFAWGANQPVQRIIVYDATRGPCAETDYQVLNLPGIHNAMYRPGENPNSIMAYPGDIPATPFPWMRPP